MAIKSQKQVSTFSKGIDMDTSVNKVSSDVYFDAENMEIISNDSLSSGALSNVKGNILRLRFAEGDHILGFCKIRSVIEAEPGKESIVFFAWNATSPSSRIYYFSGDPYTLVGIDTYVIEMNVAYHLDFGAGHYCGYIYRSDDLNFNMNYPIKAEGRYESELIKKVYWVDGYNNIRYMNIPSVNILTPATSFDINPTASLTQPVGEVVTGGAYTSGMVQYSYQLYLRNGAATTFAPPSDMLYLANNNGGTDSRNFSGSKLGENTGKAVALTISNLDTNYNRIRIVALHYTEYNANPTVNIIAELEYTDTTVNFTDNGYTVYGTIPLEEFRLFGQVNYKAKYITSKNNYLFFGDLTEDRWNPAFLTPGNQDYWDLRAVRYREASPLSSSDTIYKSDTYESDAGVTFGKGGTNSVITVEIVNFKSYVGIPGDRTSINITSLYSIVGGGNGVVGGQWHNVSHVTTNFVSTIAQSTINLVGYNAGTDTLTFNIVTSGTPYFTSSYDHINDCIVRLRDMVYVYSYNTASSYTDAVVYDNLNPTSILVPYNTNIKAAWDAAGWSNYTNSHDGVNKYNDTDNDADPDMAFKYQSDHVTLGAQGPNVDITFATEDLQIDSVPNTSGSAGYADIQYPYTDSPATTSHRSSQRSEVYRIYIVLYNTRMQYSAPQWVCDLRIPENSDIPIVVDIDDVRYARYIYPVVSIKHIPDDLELYGWQVFRCLRGTTDRSVLASGVISKTWGESVIFGKSIIRPFSWQTAPFCFIRSEDTVVGVNSKIIEVVSPEINFNKNLKYSSGDKIRVDGRYDLQDSRIATVDSNNDKLITLSLGATSPRHDNDTILSNINDGVLQSLGIIQGDPPLYPATQSIGGESYKHILRYDIGANKFHGNRGSSFIASIDTDLTTDGTNTGYILGSYVRNVFNTQYGGNRYEARSYNSVVPYSGIQPVDRYGSNVLTCYNGDTYISIFAYLRSGFPDITDGANKVRVQEMVYIPCESSINCFYRLDEIQKYYYPDKTTYKLQETVSQGLILQPIDYPIELGDLYRYNPVYSQSGTGKLIQNTLFDSNNIEHSDVKIISTSKKINNEYFDNWTNILTNNSIEVDTKYGALKNIFTLNNKMFAIQDNAIAVLAVNDRSLIQDNNKLSLTLGTGTVLERYDYLTTTSGIQNYYDMVLSGESMYYLDRKAKVIYTLTNDGGNPISEIKGYRSFLKRFKDITDVKMGYDPVHKNIFVYIDGHAYDNDGEIITLNTRTIELGFLYNWYVVSNNISINVNKDTYGALYNWYALPYYQTYPTNALYNWYAATWGSGPAPTGWHVPTNIEWQSLVTFAEQQDALKSTSGWPINGEGLDTYGFNGKPMGFRQSSDGFCRDRIDWSMYWSSTEYDGTRANVVALISSLNSLSVSIIDKKYGLSIRCVKDSTALANGQTSTVTDIDGNIYPTVCINGVEWMTSDLLVKHFNNGSDIPIGDSNPDFYNDAEWTGLISPGMCFYREVKNNLCPYGWSLPEGNVSHDLMISLDPGGQYASNTAGGQMKEIGTIYWNDPNIGANNSSGFNARGAGVRLETGVFQGLKQVLFFWNPNQYWDGTDEKAVSTLSWASAAFSTQWGGTVWHPKNGGASIRLVKNTTSLSIGDYGTMYDLDGNAYITKCMPDGREWMCENLKSEYYQDGTSIPIITDNTLWAADTQGAMCYYDNTTLSSPGPSLANTGWRVPSYGDFFTLQSYLGGQTIAGGKLKDSATIPQPYYIPPWRSPNTGATNEVNFFAKPTSLMGADNTVIVENYDTTTGYWSSTMTDISHAYSTKLYYDSANFDITIASLFNTALPIRLIKDVTTLSNGGTGTYTGNDGQIYNTICIGTQEWTATNIIETKYSDGSLIPKKDRSTWSGLTTDAWSYIGGTVNGSHLSYTDTVLTYVIPAVLTSTSVYNEYTNSFIGKQTFFPQLMFDFNNQFYSVGQDNNVWIHNYGHYGDFYNLISPSTVTKIINPNGNIVKSFDVLDLRVDVINSAGGYDMEQFDTMVISNNYQTTTKALHFSSDDSILDTTKSLARKWRTYLLPDDQAADVHRFIDTYVRIKLSRSNDSNKKLVLHDLITFYRPVKN